MEQMESKQREFKSTQKSTGLQCWKNSNRFGERGEGEKKTKRERERERAVLYTSQMSCLSSESLLMLKHSSIEPGSVKKPVSYRKVSLFFFCVCVYIYIYIAILFCLNTYSKQQINSYLSVDEMLSSCKDNHKS